MHFCPEHWEVLVKSVEKYGLKQFVAEDGVQLADYLKREQNGDISLLDFEPLIGAHNCVVQVALTYVGMAKLFSKTDNGAHRCPICELQTYNWAEGAAWQARLEAEKRGLVPADRNDLTPEDLLST